MDKQQIIKTQTFNSPVGELIVGAYQNQLCLCDWQRRKMRSAIDLRITTGLNAKYVTESSVFLDGVMQQLSEYFNGLRTKFDIPILLIGSDFQKLVWNALLKIPYGKTQTYQKLSQELGNELAIRAVASANGANGQAIIVPCHRIVGSNGKLVGYAGGLSAKKMLLKLEKADITSGQLELFD